METRGKSRDLLGIKRSASDIWRRGELFASFFVSDELISREMGWGIIPDRRIAICQREEGEDYIAFNPELFPEEKNYTITIQSEGFPEVAIIVHGPYDPYN